MEKLLTITIPTYNTEEYLPRCIESLIIPNFMDKLEILVVIDGSPDNSLEVARRYEVMYPQTIKVINKENGGHGSTINKGVEIATGKYFRVLDSDDWFDTAEFENYLVELEKWDVDFVLNPYKHFYAKDDSEQIVDFEGNLKCNTLLYVDKTDFTNLIGFKFIRLAGVAYKTKLLREANIVLPEKTYYVDTIYAFCNIHVINSYVVIENYVYYYYIGREGQSMSLESQRQNAESFICYANYLVDYYKEYKRCLSANKLWYIEQEFFVRLYRVLDILRKVRYSSESRQKLRLKYKTDCPRLWCKMKIRDLYRESLFKVARLIEK